MEKSRLRRLVDLVERRSGYGAEQQVEAKISTSFVVVVAKALVVL